MLAADLIDRYIHNHPYGVSPGHEHQLRTSIASWEAFAGRPIGISDFCDEPLNRYLDWLREHRAPDTTRTRRGNLLILWHFAWEEGLIDLPPRKVRRLRPIARQPVAWTLDEVRRLIEESTKLPGRFWRSAIRRAPWWESLIRCGYDTSLRLGDLLRLRAAEIRPQMTLVQHKTRRSVCVALRPATISAIDQTLADEPRDVVWPLWGTEETFFKHLRKLVAGSGIRPGTFRWIRRTAITQLEKIAPGRGTQLAGHAARSTTEQWYLDRSQLAAPPLPPL